MIKKIIERHHYWVLLVIGIVVLSLTYYPYPKTMIRLVYENGALPIKQSNSCSLLAELLAKEFILEYPETIRMHDRDIISLELQPSSKSVPGTHRTNNIDDCAVGLEVEIKNLDLDLKPGANISLPYTGQKVQKMQWQLYADKSINFKPVLWIYVLFDQSSDKNMQKWPLFAVPMNINIVEIWGISPLTIRYLSLAFIGMVFILIMKRKIKTGNVIIHDHK